MSVEFSRREFLAGATAVAAGAAVCVPGLVPASGQAPMLAVYDSRRSESLRFVRSVRPERNAAFYDIARAEADFWRTARAGFGITPGQDVIGMTGWSDWISLRGILVERGLRVRREVRQECGSLFEWRMA